MTYAAIGRAGYGIALLLAPGMVIRATSREPSDWPTVLVGRILGFRHLVQALIMDRAGTRSWLLAGAAIDATHALSMAGLAALDKNHRRLAALDAALAGGLTITGLWQAQNA